MNAILTVLSDQVTVVHHVRDFAKGLGCAVDGGSASSDTETRIEIADTGDMLVELLDYVALAATQAGVGPNEPLCRLMFRRGASAQVTLGLRLVELTVDR